MPFIPYPIFAEGAGPLFPIQVTIVSPHFNWEPMSSNSKISNSLSKLLVVKENKPRMVTLHVTLNGGWLHPGFPTLFKSREL